MLGISMSYHRQLSHKSFRCVKPLEYLLAYCGALAFEGDPIEWVSAWHWQCDMSGGEWGLSVCWRENRCGALSGWATDMQCCCLDPRTPFRFLSRFLDPLAPLHAGFTSHRHSHNSPIFRPPLPSCLPACLPPAVLLYLATPSPIK